MWWWMALAAMGGPEKQGATPPPVIEVVPSFLEGSVQLVMPGREGDKVFVDGWPAGALPVVTQLMEGPHLFRVEGPSGKLEVERVVTVVSGKVPVLDLSAPEPPAPKP